MKEATLDFVRRFVVSRGELARAGKWYVSVMIDSELSKDEFLLAEHLIKISLKTTIYQIEGVIEFHLKWMPRLDGLAVLTQRTILICFVSLDKINALRFAFAVNCLCQLSSCLLRKGSQMSGL